MREQPNPDLLQALEHTLETLNRMSTLLRSTLDAVDRGEQMPTSLIADYREQLNAVDADAARMGSTRSSALECGRRPDSEYHGPGGRDRRAESARRTLMRQEFRALATRVVRRRLSPGLPKRRFDGLDFAWSKTMPHSVIDLKLSREDELAIAGLQTVYESFKVRGLEPSTSQSSPSTNGIW